MSATWAVQYHYGQETDPKVNMVPWGANDLLLDTMTMKDMVMDMTKPPDDQQVSPLLSPSMGVSTPADPTMLMDMKSIGHILAPTSHDGMDTQSDTQSSIHELTPVTETQVNMPSPHGQKRPLVAIKSKNNSEDKPMDMTTDDYRNPTPERDKMFYTMPGPTSPDSEKDYYTFTDMNQQPAGKKMFFDSPESVPEFSAGQARDQFVDEVSMYVASRVHGNGQEGSDGPDVQITGEDLVIKKCLVCGDEATGMYFGALVCVPCKTFFLRYAGDNFNFVCKHNQFCEMTIATRTQCKYCRFQKCLQVGMCRRERPAKVELMEGQQLCVVCQDVANGVHFGAITCEGCKKFFRRGLKEHGSYSCKLNQQCEINPRTRNSCRYCRYNKCILAGMSREAIQMGRPSKFKPSQSHLQQQLSQTSSDSGHGSGQVPFQFMRQQSQSPWLSVSTEDGASPLKQIKTEPLSPSSIDSYRYSPQMPGLTSPGLMMQHLSPLGRSSDSQRNYQMLDMNLSPGVVTPVGPVSLEALSPTSGTHVFLTPSSKGQGVGTSNMSMGDTILQLSQSAAASIVKTSVPLQLTPQGQAQVAVSLPSPSTANVPRNIASRVVSHTQSVASDKSQSQYTSSHPGTLSGGFATTFNPMYVVDNKRYITNHHVYNAFVQDALEHKVKLSEKTKSRKSSSKGGSSSTTSSHLGIGSEMDYVMDGDPRSKDQMATLNSLTLAASGSMSSLQAAGAASYASEPSTPAMSSPSSPGRLEMPGMTDLEGVVGTGSKSETVDYILFSQLMTSSSLDNLDSKDTMLSPPSGSSIELPSGRQRSVSPVPAASLVPSSVASGNTTTLHSESKLVTPDRPPPPTNTHTPTNTKHLLGEPTAASTIESSPLPCNTSSPATRGTSPQEPLYGSQTYSPMVAHENNKSPGSSSSASCSSTSSSSQFADNGSVYDYIMELSKQVDLVKRRDDSDSEGSEKDGHNAAQNLLAQDTSKLEFKNFEEYWLKNTMPDENIMITNEHYGSIRNITSVYQQFVETGTKINKKLRKELDNWMKMHEGQFTAPPAWINEKVVPIYTLMSVTYCRNLPGFVDYHRRDQSTIIKLGQSQSRILVAARHWYDPELGDFRDFMSWRGAKTGTGDEFKRKLIEYAQKVQQAKLDDVEAAIMNVLVLIATDYPELQNPGIIGKARLDIMNLFRAYTTAKFGAPNTRMEDLFQLVPTLRKLGLQHHRMTFHMHSARTTSSSSNT